MMAYPVSKINFLIEAGIDTLLSVKIYSLMNILISSVLLL